MEKQNKTEIDKIDEALRLLWLDAGLNASLDDSRKELATILSTPVVKEMSAEKQEELLSGLFTAMTTISLGELVTAKIDAESIAPEVLAAATKLSMERIEEIKKDEIYPNSIPVLLLTDLLKKLCIKFDAAERAIMKSFEIVYKRALLAPAFSTGAAYRRASSDEKEDVRTVLRKNRNELYENKDALYKYLDKLEKLMSQ